MEAYQGVGPDEVSGQCSPILLNGAPLIHALRHDVDLGQKVGDGSRCVGISPSIVIASHRVLLGVRRCHPGVVAIEESGFPEHSFYGFQRQNIRSGLELLTWGSRPWCRRSIRPYDAYCPLARPCQVEPATCHAGAEAEQTVRSTWQITNARHE